MLFLIILALEVVVRLFSLVLINILRAWTFFNSYSPLWSIRKLLILNIILSGLLFFVFILGSSILRYLQRQIYAFIGIFNRIALLFLLRWIAKIHLVIIITSLLLFNDFIHYLRCSLINKAPLLSSIKSFHTNFRWIFLAIILIKFAFDWRSWFHFSRR